jgi:hypothetical protein
VGTWRHLVGSLWPGSTLRLPARENGYIMSVCTCEEADWYEYLSIRRIRGALTLGDNQIAGS